jgi:nitrogen fixation protein NifB
MAVQEGIVVKVNTVLIPTINDTHIIEVAKKIKELGVFTQNIVPLIPLSRFAHSTPPSPIDIKRLQNECARVIKQVTHCRQCRADAVGLLHEDMSAQLFC